MVKFGDKNYVIGVTYRDQVDANGDSVATWDFAMVFDDKQRICIDQDTNGDEGVQFNIGHQIFGPQQFRVVSSRMVVYKHYKQEPKLSVLLVVLLTLLMLFLLVQQVQMHIYQVLLTFN